MASHLTLSADVIATERPYRAFEGLSAAHEPTCGALDSFTTGGMRVFTAQGADGIDAYRHFFNRAERHGCSPQKLFEGMKVPKAKNADTARRPFTKE